MNEREFARSHSLYAMSGFVFTSVAKTEEARAYQTLVSAFTDDPVERWLYPELPEYLTHFPKFLAAFGGRAFDAQTVWRLSEFSAVAPWLPPGGAGQRCHRCCAHRDRFVG